MPGTPMRPLKMVMEKIIQNPERPVESPRILGPRKLPSNCCKIQMKMIKYRHCIGLTIKISNAQGTAPIKGPKNGIMLVTPTMTLISIGYGIFMMLTTTKQRTPMMAESKIFPLINPPKVESIRRRSSIITLACLVSQKAYKSFFPWLTKRSLLASR